MNEHDVVVVGERKGGPPPCKVRHEDAGGQCHRPAAMKVYGLNFCEAHGEEARIGASLREHYEAGVFFERFQSSHVPAIGGLVGSEVEAALTRLYEEGPTDGDHSRALKRAYPNPPESVRMRVRNWELDVGERGPTPLDYLLEDLATINTLMRIAYEDEATFLVEMLEGQRESVAAMAAVADDRHKIGLKD